MWLTGHQNPITTTTTGLFCMALVEQLGDDRWYVQLAAIWHWYLPSCIYITVFILYCVCPFLFMFFFNLVSIN